MRARQSHERLLFGHGNFQLETKQHPTASFQHSFTQKAILEDHSQRGPIKASLGDISVVSLACAMSNRGHLARDFRFWALAEP